MTVKDWLYWVEQNRKRVRVYDWGGDGTDGRCDCIGLIIGALRLSGWAWNGTHGSNYAARYQVTDMHSTKELELGEVVFKVRRKGDADYNLPSNYAKHADQNDYYHVGVVTSVNPLRILHCTSVTGGIKEDTAVGAWAYAGKLKAVMYGNPEQELDEHHAVVNSKAVAIRKDASTESKVLVRVDKGGVVELLPPPNGWTYVKSGDFEGWMMTQFLTMKGDG